MLGGNRQQILNYITSAPATPVATPVRNEKRQGLANPYRFGIKITRPKTYSMADKALQVEANRATRHVGELNDELKLPMARIPAVLAYLRWLDKMDAWYRKSGSINETSARLRDAEDLYSWNSGFGSPLVLPRIRKHPDPEKYRSKQVQKTMIDPNLCKGDSNYAEAVHHKRAMRQAHAHARFQNASAPLHDREFSYDTSTSEVSYGTKGKHTKFYIHAMNGFKYWPAEKYSPPVHHTKYSFGTQFNPGRAGVVTDRIYTRPRSNKHYWTEFQLRQNPIGSGNSVTGRVLTN